MTTKMQNRITVRIAILFAVAIVIALMSCSTPRTMKDCKGVRHTKQAGGFYL